MVGACAYIAGARYTEKGKFRYAEILRNTREYRVTAKFYLKYF